MEGPSLFLAQEQLKPFKGKVVESSVGNTKAIDPASLEGLTVKDIFAWGKHLVFQFDTFALRFHFLLFGTFEAEVDGVWVTGDYRRAREPRLALTFANGIVNTYNCSVKVVESKNAKKEYDYGIDIMSPKWEEAKVRKLVRAQPREEIADVLLNQEIFAGVGNIIKNEVLGRMKIAPERHVEDIPAAKLRALIADTREFSRLFYTWRKKFELRKHLLTHRKGACQYCGRKLMRAKTGKRVRWSYWCPIDQT